LEFSGATTGPELGRPGKKLYRSRFWKPGSVPGTWEPEMPAQRLDETPVHPAGMTKLQA